MTLLVYTSRINYGGPDRLDVTAGGLFKAKKAKEKFEGAAFAPTGKLVGWGKNMMREAERRRVQNDPGAADFAEWVWKMYAQRYHFLMRESYKKKRRAWDRLLARERVVLVCYCVDGERCHRRLLAGYLEKLGALDRGEVDTTVESDRHGTG